MIIIFIRGFAGAGKDTLGKIFTERFGYTRFAFADFLKQMVSEKYDVPLAVLHSQEGKREICPRTGQSWRQVLLNEASEQRAANPDIFASMCADAIEHASIQDDKFVITDWRFPNEFRVLYDRFPTAQICTVLIRRKSQNGVSPVQHPSEYLLIDTIPDFIVDNNTTEDKLVERAEYIQKILVEDSS
jgi:adenylate kinase family enzyme